MMRREPEFYVCKHCGNIIGLINNAGVPLVCCGEKMSKLDPNTSDGATEKHLPVITTTDSTDDGSSKVKVHISTVDHPMVKEHHIEWVYLFTREGGQRKELEVGGEPEVTFALTESDDVIAAYAYCNLHGLWKTKA